MPQLNPESMSMIGLNLFQQLSHLSKITNASCENPLSEDQVSPSVVGPNMTEKLFTGTLSIKPKTSVVDEDYKIYIVR